MARRKSDILPSVSDVEDQRIKFLSQIWQFIEQAIVITDVEGVILYLNPYAEKLYGWSEKEARGECFIQEMVANDHQRNTEEMMTILRDGKSSSCELLVQHRSGSTFPTQMTHTPICDDSGNLQSVMHVSHYIDDHKRAADKALRKTENIFRLIAQNTPDVIFAQDDELKYTWISNPAPPLTPEEVIGKTDRELLSHEEAVQLENFKKEMLRSGKAKRMEFKLSPGGESRWYDAIYYPIYDDTRKVKGLASYARDITELKQTAEKLQEKLSLLEAFHEIDRTIMSTTDMDISLRTILEKLSFELGIDAAAIFALNPYMQILDYKQGHGFRSKEAHKYLSLRVGEGIAGLAAKERRIISIPDLSEATGKFKLHQILKDEDFVSVHSVPLIFKGEVCGVMQIFQRSLFVPNDECLNLINMFAGQAAIAISNVTLFNDLSQVNSDLIQAYNETIEGWSRALDMRDNETEGHSRRVTELTLKLAKAAGIKEEELAHIRRGALLHDIGKVGVPDAILLKPGELIKDEWVVMRKHATYAYELLSPISYLRPAMDIPYCHHEKWDGSGYPRGLKGEQIPLAVRLFSVVDIWDALRSERPYRNSWSSEKTLDYIRSLSGSHLDPYAVDLFIELIKTEMPLDSSVDS